jgi:hypothetical protein
MRYVCNYTRTIKTFTTSKDTARDFSLRLNPLHLINSFLSLSLSLIWNNQIKKLRREDRREEERGQEKKNKEKEAKTHTHIMETYIHRAEQVTNDTLYNYT